MLRGLVFMLVLAGMIAVLGPWLLEALFDAPVAGVRFQALLAAMVAGSLGGVLSVMMRFSRRTLRIRKDADMKRVRQLGMFRPVVGSMFAVAINVIVLAELIPQLTIGPEVPFFTAVGFLAGFSERWAQDMVAVAGGSFPPPEADGRN